MNSALKARLKKIRFVLAPRGTQRERFYHALRVAYSIWRTSGLRIFQKRLPWWWRTYLINSRSSTDIPQLKATDYARWIRRNEPSKGELELQRESFGSFAYQPLITVATAVFDPEPQVLRSTIQSVMEQTYPKWELCLVDGASSHPGVRQVLDARASRDARIQVKHLPSNLGISGNLNEAIQMSQGEYVLFLDHDDLLSPNALFEIVLSLNEDPSLEVIYFDEDKISADGERRNAPWFKPAGWSPDLLLSTNYLMHSVICRDLLVELGGFDPAMDGAQDWDLALRITEKPRKIAHIPQVFYHWRQVPGSAASDANAKPWAFVAQKRCIEAHLRRLGVSNPQVDFPSLGLVHIRWPLSWGKVSIIIPTKNKIELLRACLKSIVEQTTYPDYEIILVDNGSTDPDTLEYYERLRDDPRIKILDFPGPFNYHLINNTAAHQAQGEILVFLNNDTEVLEPAWLEELAGWAERSQVGVVGTKLLRPGGSIQHAGIIMGLAGHGSHIFEGAPEHFYGPFGSTEWYRNYHAVTGACLAVRRDVFDQLGGFDEVYQVGYGDIDLCLRAENAGFRVVYTPFARLSHHEGGSRGLSLPPADVLRASVTMYDQLRAGDRYFNPNLSRSQRLPTIAQANEKDSLWFILKILYDFDLIGREDRGAEDESRWVVNLDHSLIPLPETVPAGKKLLFVTHELSRSGAPIIFWEIARLLREHGYTITVLSPFDGPLRAEYLSAGMQVQVLPSILEDARIILNYLDGHDLVFINTILGFRTVHAAKAFNKPCIWWVHESNFGLEMAGSSTAVAQAFSAADAVIFPSQATADLYAAFSQAGNYFPLHTGLKIDLADRADTAELIERDPGKLRLIQVASLETRKGQDVLLKAISALPPQVSANIDCYLVGRILAKSEPKYCKKVTTWAERLPNVHVLGDLPVGEVRKLLASCDVFVLPSRDEALPISLLEAIAFGKAVIATRVGGVPEIIEHGQNGLLVENEDAQGLAAAIERFYSDRLFLQKLGAEARCTFQDRFTFDYFGQQIVNLVDRKHA
jgi:GT2 family glycosyltransferase/glycosyltransferase involved in cell wall biosynthesis